MKRLLGHVSKGWLWGIATVLIIWFALWLIAWPIAIMAPSTNHYKMVDPFSTAIELELGKAKTAALVNGERLGYCSYIPVRMCVKLFLNQAQMGAGDLDRVRQIARDICGVLQRANPVAVQELKFASYRQPIDFRQTLKSFAHCLDTGRSMHAESSDFPLEVSNGFLILTLVEPPVYAYQITFDSK